MRGVKTVETGGISYLAPLTGSPDWYWGTDHTHGDLYEAEELYRDGHRIRQNRVILVRRDTGAVYEPVQAKPGQYFGAPVFRDGRPVLLLADFPAGELRVLAYDADADAVEPVVTLPKRAVEDCYNLMLHLDPLCLTRQTGEAFELIWPERASFSIAPQETFCFRAGERLYFEKWFEDPDYRTEIIVRDLTGKLLDRHPGSAQLMPDGQLWILK